MLQHTVKIFQSSRNNLTCSSDACLFNYCPQTSELNEQATKIARLIRQLKQQERAYVELLERSVVSIYCCQKICSGVTL